MNSKKIQDDYVAPSASSVKKVVCIMSYTSSASGLMASLFDNHPNVLMFPDNVISGFQDFWERNESLQLQHLLDKFIEKYITIFDARETPLGLENSAETGESRGFTSLGINRDQHLEVDKVFFCNLVKSYVGNIYPVPRKLFFQSIHLAYGKSLGREIENPIIVFGLHNLTFPGRLKALVEDFSDIHFLTMVRNPLNAAGSRFRSQIRNGVAISHFKKIMNGISKGGTSDPITPHASWKSVRMEDLHQFPQETMENISNWLDLPWNNSLLESTIHGKKWWNEKQSMQISGFNTSVSSQDFGDFISFLDRLRLSVLLSKKSLSWQYNFPWWSHHLLVKIFIVPLLILPFRMEYIVWKKLISDIFEQDKILLIKISLSIKTLVGGFLLGRLTLIRSWVILFASNYKEVELL